MNAPLERTILRVLRDAHPNMVPERKLFADTNVEHDTAVSKASFDRSLNDLQQKEGGAQVTGIPHEDAGHKWKITAEGLARLA